MTEMQQVAGLWFPKHDTHMTEWVRRAQVHGVGVYQYPKLRAAVEACRRKRTAVDVGAHVGTWTAQLVWHFESVVAVEPHPVHFECLEKNLVGRGGGRVVMLNTALGDAERSGYLLTKPGNSGETWIVAEDVCGMHPITTVRLDDLDIPGVDLLKVDCEGYEPFVLRGGEQTIRRDLPVIMVEQDERYAARYNVARHEAVRQLEVWGYRTVRQMTCDYLMVHPASVHNTR